MYFNEVQQGLWHYFPSSTKVLIPRLSKPLRNICFKEDIFCSLVFHACYILKTAASLV